MRNAKIIHTLMAAAVLCTLCSESALAAEKSYVADQLVITVRTEPNDSSAIVTHLRTGDAVDILQRPSGSAYARVRTDEGAEGWSQHQYLVAAPPASVRLEQLQAEHDALAAQHRQTLTQLEDLQVQYAAAQSELANLESLTDQAAFVDSADSSPALDDMSDQTTPDLPPETRPALDQRAWFIAGAGVLAAGMVLGWTIGWIMRRRRWVW